MLLTVITPKRPTKKSLRLRLENYKIDAAELLEAERRYRWPSRLSIRRELTKLLDQAAEVVEGGRWKEADELFSALSEMMGMHREILQQENFIE